MLKLAQTRDPKCFYECSGSLSAWVCRDSHDMQGPLTAYSPYASAAMLVFWFQPCASLLEHIRIAQCPRVLLLVDLEFEREINYQL